MFEGDDRLIADRLNDMATPADSMKLWGHENALQSLVQAHCSGRLHHAWLISGQRGIGKATLAFHFARHLISNPDSETAETACDPSRWSESIVGQVAQAAHPELMHLTRPWDEKTKKFKSQLSVSEIRRTQNFYGLTAGAGGWRITIVDAADDMNANAANALLKILEEPPKRALFLVLTHSPGGLLPTIRSRCQALHLKPLGSDEILSALNHFCPELPSSQVEQAASLAEGSVRKGIQLAQSDVLKHYEVFRRLMNEMASGNGGHWEQVHSISDQLSRKGAEDDYSLFLDLILSWIGAQVRDHDGNASATMLATWAEVWE